MSKEIITRKEAKALGLKNYYTGVPCKYGHLSDRQVCSGQCNTCKRERTRKWREKPDSEKYQNKRVAKELPSKEELEDIFTYDEITGNLFWKERPMRPTEDKRTYKSWLTSWCGKVAGSRHFANGYIEVRVPNKGLHKAHRIIWKLKTGEDPLLPIDHKNGIPWDNSWDNLRLATNQENSRNRITSSVSGFKGVTYREDTGWMVQWCVNDINHSRYGFNSATEAAKHYDSVVRNLYGEFAKLNFPEEDK